MFAVVLLWLVVCCCCCVTNGSDVWTPCPYEIPAALTAKYLVDCANLSVPLSWDAADDSNITAFVTRLSPLNTSVIVSRHLWFLEGGPGGGGQVWLDVAVAVWNGFDLLALFGGDTAILLPDHRGTGLSSPLPQCPTLTPPLSTAECLAYITPRLPGPSVLRSYTPTNAARDLDFLISQLSTPFVGRHVHVFGASYGTYWAQRFLHVRTVPIESVVLDGVLSVDRAHLIRFDFELDTVGKRFLSRCASDPSCKKSFVGGLLDPLAALHTLESSLKAGNQSTCFDQLTPPLHGQSALTALQTTISSFLVNMVIRPLVPPIIHRLVRCSPSDVVALSKLFNNNQQQHDDNTLQPVKQSAELRINIDTSELLTPTPWIEPPLAELLAAEESLLFTSSVVRPLHEMWVGWGSAKYPVDKFFGKYPPLDGSFRVLLMNGDLDAPTPVESAEFVYNKYRSLYPQVNISFIKFPGSPHGTPVFSPVPTTPVPCGLEVMASFVVHDGPVIKTSCVDQMTPYDWLCESPVTKYLSNHFLGTPNAWDNN